MPSKRIATATTTKQKPSRRQCAGSRRRGRVTASSGPGRRRSYPPSLRPAARRRGRRARRGLRARALPVRSPVGFRGNLRCRPGRLPRRRGGTGCGGGRTLGFGDRRLPVRSSRAAGARRARGGRRRRPILGRRRVARLRFRLGCSADRVHVRLRHGRRRRRRGRRRRARGRGNDCGGGGHGRDEIGSRRRLRIRQRAERRRAAGEWSADPNGRCLAGPTPSPPRTISESHASASSATSRPMKRR